MMEITPFKSKVELRDKARRFASYVDGRPALFFEFFPDRYQFYGTRRGTVDELIDLFAEIHEALHAPYQPSDRYEIVATRPPGTTADTQPSTPKTLHDLQHMPAPTYCAIRSAYAGAWTDLGPTPNPHTGILAKYRLTTRSPHFIQRLTNLALSDRDLDDTLAFLQTETQNNYGSL